MKIINNDFYTNNWQDFVHSWVMRRVEHLVQRYDLPLDVDTIESFRIDTTEYGTHDFVFTYTKDGVEHTLTITPKNDDVEISISDNSTWVVNGEDTGKNTAGQMGSTGKQGLKGVVGDKGPIGKKGITGLQGPQGNRGVTGDKGEKGLIGKKGETGLQGEQGLQGPQGDRGKTGIHGEQGKQGLQGMKGETGDQGPRGVAGTVTGEKGPIGPTGAKGETGDKGPTGSQGPQGIIGETGNKGPIGETGDQGPMGDQGPIGPQGPVGDKGPQGDAGHHPSITIGANNHFYVDDVDTEKPSVGQPGKLTGVNTEAYVNQMYNTIGNKEDDLYSCLGDSDFRRYYGSVNNSVSELYSNYIIPTRSDENFYDLTSTPYSSIKLFSSSITKIKSILYSSYGNIPSSIGICGVPFGIDCMSQLVGDIDYTSYESSWFFFNGSPFYLTNNEILQGIAINDYNKWEFMLKAYTTGIIKYTDENGNVRTFQPVGVLYRYSSSSTGDGLRHCPVLRAYRKGPQSQWSTNFSPNSSYYRCKMDVIDNDGNPIDFENGGFIVSHAGDYFTSLWNERKDEMNV